MTLPDDDGLEEIRTLLFEPVRSRVETLTDAELAERLPDIIRVASESGEALDASFRMPVIRAFLELARTQPDLVVSALFPVMLPAIRLAVRSAVENAMSGFNQAASDAVSPRGIRWRVEALLSGRSFAEVALAARLDWRVRQVMVMDRESALVVGSAVDPAIEASDPDQVAAMLDAISMFAAESFGIDSTEQGVGTLNIGGMTVWVERTPLLLGAMVLDGSPPRDIRDELQALLIGLHDSIDPLDPTVKELGPTEQGEVAALVRAQLGDPDPPSTTPIVIAGIVAFVVVLLTIGGFVWDGRVQTQRADALRSTVGVDLLDVQRTWLGWKWLVLHDPTIVADDDVPWPAGWRHEVGVHSFIAHDPEAIRVRLGRVLPDGIGFSLRPDRTVSLDGVIPESDRPTLPLLARVPGVVSIDIDGVSTHEDRAARQQLEEWSAVLTFQSGRTDFDPAPLKAILPSARRIAGRFHLQIGTDLTGNPTENQRLARARIRRISEHLQGLGYDVDETLDPTPSRKGGRTVTVEYRIRDSGG